MRNTSDGLLAGLFKLARLRLRLITTSKSAASLYLFVKKLLFTGVKSFF